MNTKFNIFRFISFKAYRNSLSLIHIMKMKNGGLKRQWNSVAHQIHQQNKFSSTINSEAQKFSIAKTSESYQIQQYTKFSSTKNSAAQKVKQRNKFSSAKISAAYQIQHYTKFSSTKNSAAQQIQQLSKFSKAPNSATNQIKLHTKLPQKRTQKRYINTYQQCQQFCLLPIYCRHNVP